MRKEGEWRKDRKSLLRALGQKSFLNVDFDGVIAKTAINCPTDKGIEGKPVKGALDFLRESIKHFWVVICSTRCCVPAAKGFIAAWLLEHGLESSVLKQIIITDQKAPGIILDDRAWQFTGEFPAIADLLAFKPWHGKGIIDDWMIKENEDDGE